MLSSLRWMDDVPVLSATLSDASSTALLVHCSATSSDASSTALLVHCSATSSMRRPLLCSSTALQRRLMRCPLVRRIGESKREIYCMLAKNAVMLKMTKTYIDSCTMADGRTYSHNRNSEAPYKLPIREEIL